MGKKAEKLSPMQKAFCLAYMELQQGKAAAIKAGYSPATAEVAASKLLRQGKVLAEVKRLEDKREKKGLMRADEVEAILDAIIKTTVKDLTNEAGMPKAVSELTDEQAHAVDSLDVWEKQTKDGGLLSGTSVKTNNKIQAIQTKMKRLGMMIERHEVEVGTPGEFQDRLEQARKRAAEAIKSGANRN
jgi:phage terminase small subunit